MPRFSGKVAIITGSSNGIGRCTAVLMAKDGAKVTITGRNAERLEITRQTILKSGVPAENVNSVIGDVTNEAVQNQLIASTIEKFGKLDILINNAGAAMIDSNGAEGLDQNLNTFERTVALNLRSVIGMIQKARPYLAQSKGEIVNVSSIAAGPQAFFQHTYYSIVKAALDQLTRNTAIGLIPEGIRVNSVSPGSFNRLQGSNGSTERCRRKVGVTGQPEDIANAIAFLADRNVSSYIIGQSIVADGGTSLVTSLSQHSIDEILAS